MNGQNRETAERLARIWRGGAAQASSMGLGEAEIGKSMVAIGLERWLAAETPDLIADQLRKLTLEFVAMAEQDLGIDSDGSKTSRH